MDSLDGDTQNTIRDPLSRILDKQEQAWDQGMRVPIEQLAEELPDDATKADRILMLVANEVQLRREAGEAPSLSEYQLRFPQFADRLKIHWHVDRWLAKSEEEHPLPSDAEDCSSSPHEAITALNTNASTTIPFEPENGFLIDAPVELLNHPRYRLIRKLGLGGMGVVYLAVHKVMNRPVAIKVICPELLSSKTAMERFQREVRSLARLQHPNIVTAHDAEAVDSLSFLIVEYIEGQTLSERLRGGNLPWAEACTIIRDAARGLAHAHERGFVHRDVKPGNLMISKDGTVKVLDFGLVFDRSTSSAISGVNAIMGTPDYMAPEQMENSRNCDSRSDIYSLGCTLYHAISGRAPYGTLSTIQKLDAHRFARPEPLESVPKPLAATVMRMMANDPLDRYQTAQDVVDALEPFCIDSQTLPERSNKRRFTSSLLSRRALIFGSIAAGVVGVGKTIQLDRFPFTWHDTPKSKPGQTSPIRVRSHIPTTGDPKSAPIPRQSISAPTSLGDGSVDDYRADGFSIYITTQKNWQTWLNYRSVESPELVVDCSFRFLDFNPDSLLKFAFTADDVGEYGVLCFPASSRLELNETFFGKKTTRIDQSSVANFDRERWVHLLIRMSKSRITTHLDGNPVITGPYQPSRLFWFSVAAQHCSVEIKNGWVQPSTIA